MKDKLPDQSHVEELVVVSGKIITSQGPGTSIAFSLKLVELLYNKQKSKQVADALLVKYDL